MAYDKTIWVDRNDPTFDIYNAEALGMDNLNKLEQGVADAQSGLENHTHDYEPTDPNIVKDANYVHTDANLTQINKLQIQSIDNLSTAVGTMYSSLTQNLDVIERDVTWVVSSQSTDTGIIELNDNNTFTIKSPGTYNIRASTIFTSATSNAILATISIVDSINSQVWHTENIALSMESGEVLETYSNKALTFASSDLPKTLKIIQTADGAGMRISQLTYTINTLTGGSGGSHLDLSGRDDPNCHPISAITGLEEVVVGQPMAGEAV